MTNLVELVRIERNDSGHVMQKFAHYWLTLHQWPQHCVHDPGEDFAGEEFQTLLQNCHIRDICTTAKSPQSNTVHKRIHQTVRNILRAVLHDEAVWH